MQAAKEDDLPEPVSTFRLPTASFSEQEIEDSEAQDAQSFYPLYTKISRGVLKPILFGAVFDLCAKYPARRLILDLEEEGRKFDLLIGFSERTTYVGYRVVLLGKNNALYVGEIDEQGVLRIQRTGAYTLVEWFLEIDSENIRSNMTPQQWEAFRSDTDELQGKIKASLARGLEADDPSLLSADKIPKPKRLVSLRAGTSYFEGKPWAPDRNLGLHLQADFTRQERFFPFGEGWSLGYAQIFAPKGERRHELSWLTRTVALSGHVEVALG
ncbi:MAG: hypothetical protein HYY44_04115 [Deltaproteobacteria bacterium]|nr:hypothetical protein [Deltaproteobacteria bacterium]